MPQDPVLENFTVAYGPPGTRPGAQRPVVNLPADGQAYGVHFTVEGDWTSPAAGTWEVGLRVLDETGAVLPVSDGAHWFEQYSIPVDFKAGARFHDQTVFLVGLSQTATLTFVRLLEGEAVASARLSVEVRRQG